MKQLWRANISLYLPIQSQQSQSQRKECNKNEIRNMKTYFPKEKGKYRERKYIHST